MATHLFRVNGCQKRMALGRHVEVPKVLGLHQNTEPHTARLIVTGVGPIALAGNQEECGYFARSNFALVFSRYVVRLFGLGLGSGRIGTEVRRVALTV